MTNRYQKIAETRSCDGGCGGWLWVWFLGDKHDSPTPILAATCSWECANSEDVRRKIEYELGRQMQESA